MNAADKGADCAALTLKVITSTSIHLPAGVARKGVLTLMQLCLLNKLKRANVDSSSRITITSCSHMEKLEGILSAPSDSSSIHPFICSFHKHLLITSVGRLPGLAQLSRAGGLGPPPFSSTRSEPGGLPCTPQSTGDSR